MPNASIEALIFDNTVVGDRNPRVDPAQIENTPTVAQSGSSANNYVPAAAPTNRPYYDDDGKINGATTEGPVAINKDTTALKQKGDLHEDGESGNPDLKNDTAAFKNAVQTAAGVLGAAAIIKSLTANNRPRDPVNNYYLTAAEKNLLEAKASQFAAPGVVPFDVIEQFLYIIVTIDNYEDLSYIAAVTGVDELDDRRLVRNPSAILNLNNLYKVGYLANGLSAINKQFSSQYHSASYAGDHQNSILGPLLGVASFSSSPLGALSNVYGVQQAVKSIGLTGSAATAAALALTNAGSIAQFPGVNIVTDVVGGVASQLGQVFGITQLFGTPGGFGGLGGQIGQLGNVAGQLTSVAAQTLAASTIVANHGLASTIPIAAALLTLSKQIKKTANHTNQLSQVTTVAASAAKSADVSQQLAKVNSMTMDLVSNVAGITSLLSAIKGPGSIGSAASMLQRVGGFAASGVLTQMVLGQSVPASVSCRNPMMQSPSYAGRAFFGEHPAPRMAVDDVFCRRIAAYPSNQAGSGLMGFVMQNFGTYGGGGLSVAALTSLVTLGVATPPQAGALGAAISALSSNIGGLMGGSSSSIVDPRRSDNAIPFMIAASAAMVKDTKTPFNTKVFTNGWQVASSVGNHLQKHAPDFLHTVRTGL